jgi:hypothetical protein
MTVCITGQSRWRVHRGYRVLVPLLAGLLTVACRQTAGPCDDDTVPAIPLIRVIATDSVGRPLAARVTRIRADGTRSDTVPLQRIGELGTPPKGQVGAMTVAVIADGYREAIVELPEVCFGEAQPITVQMRR